MTTREAFGMHEPPESRINRLRQMLAHGGYELGFSIVKELVQNADDAGARTLWIGQSEPLPEARHPLLALPALFAVNDGPLRRDDVKAIRTFGLTNKGGDANKVGRFGLGLKSIFHLCEAFFLVAPRDPEDPVAAAQHRRPWGNLVNPWRDTSGDRRHPAWDAVHDDDLAAIAQASTRALEAQDRPRPSQWVCFWLPLRGSGGVPPIVNQYPLKDGGLERVLSEEAPAEIARLLPLLANLERVELCRPSQRATIALGPRSKRRATFVKEPASRRRRLQGTVVWSSPGDSAEHELRYIGFEQELSDPDLSRLVEDPAWPRSFTYDEELQPREEPEKAHAHGAALLLWEPRSAPDRLQVAKAVFLPLGGAPLADEPWDLRCRALFLLHGYLFCSERRDQVEVEPSHKSSPDLRRRWNAHLFECATLGAVVPALAELAKEGDDVLVEGVTRILADELLAPNEWMRQPVCARSQWVRRVGSDGAARWTRVGEKEEILEVPPSPDGGPPPLAGLPGVKRLCAERVVTVRSWPRLTARREPASWEEHDLVLALEGVTADPSATPWVVGLLEEQQVGMRLSEPPSGPLADAVTELLRAALRARAGRAGRQDESLLRRLAALVPRTRQLSLEVASRDGALVPARFRALLGAAGVTRVAVPCGLVPPAVGRETPLGLVEAEQFLRALAEDPEPARETSELAAQIVAACPGAEQSGRVLGLAVFAGRAADGTGWQLCTLVQLRKLATCGLAFAVHDDRNNTIADAFARAVVDGPVLLLGRHVGKWADAPHAEPQAARKLLAAARPPLAPAERRSALLAVLTVRADLLQLEVQERRGLRYLLHGQAEDDATTPLLTGSFQEGGVWGCLAERALALRNEGWRWIPNVLADALTSKAQGEVGVQPINRKSVVALLETSGVPVERLDLADLSDASLDASHARAPRAAERRSGRGPPPGDLPASDGRQRGDPLRLCAAGAPALLPDDPPGRARPHRARPDGPPTPRGHLGSPPRRPWLTTPLAGPCARG